jgi:hypothetical protein
VVGEEWYLRRVWVCPGARRGMRLGEWILGGGLVRAWVSFGALDTQEEVLHFFEG